MTAQTILKVERDLKEVRRLLNELIKVLKEKR